MAERPLSDRYPGQRDRLRVPLVAWVVGLLALLALLLSLATLRQQLGGAPLGATLWAPDTHDMRQLIVHYSSLPRLAVALLCGAALGLVGCVLQQVLRNPLAEPTTLGISAGAQLAVTAATLHAPALMLHGPVWPALIGALLAAGLVFGLAAGRGFSPLALILAGLVVSLCCDAFANVLILFNHSFLRGMFMWSSGNLGQNDWSAVLLLLPALLIFVALIRPLSRALSLFELNDDNARSLGGSPGALRAVALVLCVGLAAITVASVGVIGFIGLAAPNLARLMGARRFVPRMLWATLLGAALLWLADSLVVRIPAGYHEVPTGTATALLGVPLLVWLLPRLRPGGPNAAPAGLKHALSALQGNLLLLGCLLALLLAVLGALTLGQGPDGWHVSLEASLQALRAPRIAAALAAGAMLAGAGCLVQRLTHNPMASPEIIGVSSGAAFGVVVLAFVVSAATRSEQLLAGALGAMAVLLGLLALERRSALAAERLILAGIALSTLFGVLVAVLMAVGDPRMGGLLAWLAGSTYQVSGHEALFALASMAVLLACLPLSLRWLGLLQLGAPQAQALGLAVRPARTALLLLIALLSAAATLVVGPLSFVGLMAPHMARLLGLRRPGPQLAGAVLIGALLMVLADWLGRNLIYPFQIPAGLVATAIGCPYFMWLLRRNAA
ncbi:Fe(3+)-hydroxamate ABC transporter permease FhuB [Pseudomonas sp. HR96]|uniref:Fe(3+)-hydroxamate ABC transporter permease FhuB n=1 Tax=Pseudomonas sp. HR96 TaxID=1027966 RepID=UPI002A74A2F6|nr:Fe(3+)-hydroxamate ABC transporter permease FhuB [Pseudomonas sp. HR96]WPP02045.1 Fe(3+)-hydroxamate ABC transporter permease FhuB [Pseudomonas sp. HR96]